MTFPKPMKDKEGVGLFLDLQGQALEPGMGLVYPGTKGQRRGRNPNTTGACREGGRITWSLVGETTESTELLTQVFLSSFIKRNGFPPCSCHILVALNTANNLYFLIKV